MVIVTILIMMLWLKLSSIAKLILLKSMTDISLDTMYTMVSSALNWFLCFICTV